MMVGMMRCASWIQAAISAVFSLDCNEQQLSQLIAAAGVEDSRIDGTQFDIHYLSKVQT